MSLVPSTAEIPKIQVYYIIKNRIYKVFKSVACFCKTLLILKMHQSGCYIEPLPAKILWLSRQISALGCFIFQL